MFASMVQIGTVASDGVVKKGNTASISCAPKGNEDRIDSGLHEAKGWVDERLCLPGSMKRMMIVATEMLKMELQNDGNVDCFDNCEKVLVMLRPSKMNEM